MTEYLEGLRLEIWLLGMDVAMWWPITEAR